VNNIEHRIEKLEKYTGAGKSDEVWLVVVRENTGEPSEAALEAAKREYKAKHPDWQGQYSTVIWVINEHTKELTERLLAGEIFLPKGGKEEKVG
jgi:hypothetical protein